MSEEKKLTSEEKLVKVVQTYLKEQGIYNGALDGKCDLISISAYGFYCDSKGRTQPFERTFPKTVDALPEEIVAWIKSKQRSAKKAEKKKEQEPAPQTPAPKTEEKTPEPKKDEAPPKAKAKSEPKAKPKAKAKAKSSTKEKAKPKAKAKAKSKSSKSKSSKK